MNLDGRIAGIVFVFIQLCDHQGTKAEEEQQEEAGVLCLVRPPQSLELFNFPVRFHDEATTSDSGSDGDSVDDAGPGANEFDDYAEEDDHDDKEGSRQEGPG